MGSFLCFRRILMKVMAELEACCDCGGLLLVLSAAKHVLAPPLHYEQRVGIYMTLYLLTTSSTE